MPEDKDSQHRGMNRGDIRQTAAGAAVEAEAMLAAVRNRPACCGV